jgi:hypothetical protein
MIVRYYATERMIREPPDPHATCICGADSSQDGFRYSILCPKHDGAVILKLSDEITPSAKPQRHSDQGPDTHA